MKNSIGESVILTVFGESHGPAVGVVLDGLAPGIPVDEAYIAEQLAHRRPAGAADTARVEPDRFQLVSGVYRGRTTGTPLTILIPNENVRSADYSAVETVARPSHADFTAQAKYHGFQDPRGGGHFSGRVTAGIVAAGAICRQALERKGIRLGTHILRCAGVEDAPFTDVASEIGRIEGRRFPLILDLEERVEAAILAAKAEQDSVGGVIQTGICGLPAGLGEPWFDSLEGVLARATFAVGGVKGIEFGDGFDAARQTGSTHNDAFLGNGKWSGNRSGGILGGISNGNVITFRLAVKPTPSVSLPQQTVDDKGAPVTLTIPGRHDPCIVPRIVPVVEAMAAIVIADCLLQRTTPASF